MRRHHLATLACEVEARGLGWRFVGPGEALLGVRGPRTRHEIMVVATPDGAGWSYLWPGGGIADVTGVVQVADQLVRLLT
ncbi:hypothetical protein [Actinomadura fibrosa]|uniref:Uncharacterized protein n=1 Tax=Actinomadura fibrosa TaxID=111802 RepID=A0ABW2XPW3_9ACTN